MEAFSFPPEFRARDIESNGTSIHVRSGGCGPAVVLLHGYGETNDMWVPMAVDHARDHHTVVVSSQADSFIAANIRQGLSRSQLRVLGCHNNHCAGTSAGAPLSLIKSTRNFAGRVLLAFRSTTWTSSGPS